MASIKEAERLKKEAHSMTTAWLRGGRGSLLGTAQNLFYEAAIVASLCRSKRRKDVLWTLYVAAHDVTVAANNQQFFRVLEGRILSLYKEAAGIK